MNKDIVVLDVSSKDQQLKIIDELNVIDNISAFEPKKFVPTLKIDSIQRDYPPEFDYDDFIKEEISQNLKIKKEEIVIKKIINNQKFKSIRAFVSLDKDNTIKVLEDGFIKIGYMACPVSKSCNVRQCRRCWKFGHLEKDREGNLICKSKEIICPLCSKHHDIDNCPIKGDRSKSLKCSDCEGDHASFSAKCPKKKSEELSILNKKSIC